MFELHEVVPWGRSFDEYSRMFALQEADFAGRILGCADGPASFNAEATMRGGQVVSCDPLYRFDATAIHNRISETFPQVIEQTRRNLTDFVWSDDLPDPEALGRRRMAAMTKFLDDYQQGKATGRYVAAELPRLPFADGEFELAVCSHFLFLYSEQLSEDLHEESIRELCRIGQEVRIFPLLEMGGAPSRHVKPIIRRFESTGYVAQVEQVNFEFQRGGNQMLRVTI